MIDASRPKAAAEPVPAPRTGVGYSSGPIAYRAPQAPRLKNDNAMPAATIVDGVSASPNNPAETADPARKTPSVRRRPHTSISHAATP